MITAHVEMIPQYLLLTQMTVTTWSTLEAAYEVTAFCEFKCETCNSQIILKLHTNIDFCMGANLVTLLYYLVSLFCTMSMNEMYS